MCFDEKFNVFCHGKLHTHDLKTPTLLVMHDYEFYHVQIIIRIFEIRDKKKIPIRI